MNPEPEAENGHQDSRIVRSWRVNALPWTR